MIGLGLDNKKKDNRINYLRKKYETTYDKGKYNKNQYKRFVDVVSTNYMMNKNQRKYAKHIIDNFDFNDIYTHGTSEMIVTAICFYILNKDNNKRGLRYNTNFVRSVSLDKPSYSLISQKIRRWEDSHQELNTYYIVDKESEAIK